MVYLEPKKSAFSMSLLRWELPKPLDVNLLIATISNPFLNSSTLAQSQPAHTSIVSFRKQVDVQKSQDAFLTSPSYLSPLESGPAQNDMKTAHLLQFLPPPPPLLKSQTQDGTTCIYYPNGRVAIVLANVFGYSFESASQASHTNLNSAMAVNHENLKPNANLTFMTGSLNSSFAAVGGNSSTVMVSQSVKRSYTTVIYDNSPPDSSTAVATLEPLANEPKPRAKSSKGKRGRLLAVVNPSGSCICYGPLGQPR